MSREQSGKEDVSYMLDRNSPVGVLDSGIGGFSVVRQVQRLLPGEELIYFGSGETAYNDGNSGYGLVTVKSGFEKNWYPMSGYRAPMTGDVSDAGSSGHFWTSTPMGAHNTRSLHFNTRYSGYGYSGYSGQYADSGQNGKGTAYGYPVRCMKE